MQVALATTTDGCQILGSKRFNDESAQGLVSRASPVQTAVRKPPQAAVVKSHGGERCGNVGTMIPAGTVERGERKQTVSEVSKAD